MILNLDFKVLYPHLWPSIIEHITLFYLICVSVFIVMFPIDLVSVF